MPRSPRFVWAWLLFAFAGCSLMTDFDRDKLGAAPGGDEAGAVGSPMDGQIPVDPGVETRPDAGINGGGDSAPPAACQTHSECGAGRLCCSGSCLPNTQTNCTDCGQPCSETAANACNDRVCGCGNGAACSGATPFCMGDGAAASCVECREGGDCAAGMQCVQGRCAQCDPMNNSGCNGNTPICNRETLRCEACRSNPDNCPGAPVCTPSGACGGCTANDAADCTTPTAPICDLSVNPTTCRGCESNAECMAELARPYCVNNERCSVCNPVDDTGCTANSATPDCRLNSNGVYQCQGCMNGSCPSGQVCNLTSGRCVQCRSDADCDTNSATPWCDTTSGTCRGCNFVPNSAGGGSAWCALTTLLQSPVRPVCSASSGRCVRCDATGGCSGNASRCYIPDPAMPQNNMCSACRPNMPGDCSGANPICDATSRTCRPCRPADCPTGVCGTNGSCVACVVGQTGPGSGCGGNTPRCIMGTNGPVCVQCNTAHSECPEGSPICDAATHSCLPCNAAAIPVNTRDGLCSARSAGFICAANGRCTRCEMAGNHGCNMGLCCPSESGLACFERSSTRCSSCSTGCSGATPECQPGTNMCGCTSTSCPAGQMCVAGSCVPSPGGTGAPMTTGAAP